LGRRKREADELGDENEGEGEEEEGGEGRTDERIESLQRGGIE